MNQESNTTRDRSGSRIDHLNIAVPDLAAAVSFYEPVLASIGITKMLEIPAIESQHQPAMTGVRSGRRQALLLAHRQRFSGNQYACGLHRRQPG